MQFGSHAEETHHRLCLGELCLENITFLLLFFSYDF